MKFCIMAIGKTEEAYIRSGVDEYMKRLKKYAPVEEVFLKNVKSGRQTDIVFIKEEEGKQVLKKISNNDLLVVLDERGEEMSSRQFAGFINQTIVSERKNIVFLIGGAFGVSKNVMNKAFKKISLSKMTFSHQMVRLVFIEQLYRAFTIIKGEPYHHD
jgi:23S rRNA (pseudouridine1915-N3)-methyltransferase